MILYVLIAILILLIIQIFTFNRNINEERKDHQRLCESQQASINTLDREKDDAKRQVKLLEREQYFAQKQIQTLIRENKAAQNQIAHYQQELSNLNNSLKELQRELDFYKNIREASGNLNEPENPHPVDDAQLDPEQFALCEEMERTQNHFFVTGKAGTGKSFLLNTFRKKTSKKHIVLAPTGLAALNINGHTLHSAFGYKNLVNLDIDDISSETFKSNFEKQMVLKIVSTIIIDEISMVRADTFDKIDRILRVINDTDLPFGGKQMILFGDLFQLPPIASHEEEKYLYDRYGGVHFFCADAYKLSGFQFRELTINHRQSSDSNFFEILNRVRNGTTISDDISKLNARVVQDFSIYDRFTMLVPTKSEADHINRERIRQLGTKEYSYRATILYNKHPNQNRALDTIFPIAENLRLKQGVLVMMVANDPKHRWVNGKLGIINDLSDKGIFVAIDKFIYEVHPIEFSQQEATYKHGKLTYETTLTVAQYPLIPAYAITIHKSQGQTYQNIICGINQCFADGQAYVALSRCSTLEGLHLAQPISTTSIQVNKNVLDFYNSNLSITKHQSSQ